MMTAVVTGHHEYDVVGLQTLLRSIPGVDSFPQNMEDFVTDTGNSRSQYDVVVFYNYHVPTPGIDGDEFGLRIKEALVEVSEFLVLHDQMSRAKQLE